MRSRSTIPNVALRRGAIVGTAGAAILGCARASQPGLSSTKPTVATAGYYSFAANSARPLLAARTVSFALDRIDQRDLPLDHTYRHAGTGRGVTIYVFDGGVSMDHPELVGRVRRGYSAFPEDPAICNAHGTAVAGAVAGKTLGVAPEAEIVDVKMVQCEKLRSTIRGIVDGARWTIEDHKKHPAAPAVANWSFIADTAARIPALDSAVTSLRAAGISVIVSAGNIDINASSAHPRWCAKASEESAIRSIGARPAPHGDHASTCTRPVIQFFCPVSTRISRRPFNFGTARRCRLAM